MIFVTYMNYAKAKEPPILRQSCQFKSYPQKPCATELTQLHVRLAKALRFEDRPDYAYLRRLFKELFAKEGKFRVWGVSGLCSFFEYRSNAY